jgi:hypothetical protein
MRDGREPGERPVDELPGGTALRVRDEADAAGIALEGPVVEKRRRGQVSRLSGRGRTSGGASRLVSVS